MICHSHNSKIMCLMEKSLLESQRIFDAKHFDTSSDWPKNENACKSTKINSCTKPQWYPFSEERVAYH